MRQKSDRVYNYDMSPSSSENRGQQRLFCQVFHIKYTTSWPHLKLFDKRLLDTKKKSKQLRVHIPKREYLIGPSSDWQRVHHMKRHNHHNRIDTLNERAEQT
ncbi:hypothetical protein ACLKA6_015452 [Drosophila palustris]